MVPRLFSFPNPVNEVAARTVATGVIALDATILGTQALWLTAVLAYGFVARVLTGPTLSPLGTVATRVVAPRLGGRARLVPGPPKRFAQGMGAAFGVAALGCWLAGAAIACEVLLAALLVPAFLEAAFGYCVGCKVFAGLMRLGVIPQAVCEECADLTARLARGGAGATTTA